MIERSYILMSHNYDTTTKKLSVTISYAGYKTYNSGEHYPAITIAKVKKELINLANFLEKDVIQYKHETKRKYDDFSEHHYARVSEAKKQLDWCE
jgi:hypothetical protein